LLAAVQIGASGRPGEHRTSRYGPRAGRALQRSLAEQAFRGCLSLSRGRHDLGPLRERAESRHRAKGQQCAPDPIRQGSGAANSGVDTGYSSHDIPSLVISELAVFVAPFRSGPTIPR
jgi:hypothetical protein